MAGGQSDIPTGGWYSLALLHWLTFSLEDSGARWYNDYYSIDRGRCERKLSGTIVLLGWQKAPEAFETL